jgi:hypothetical protein
MYENCLNVEQNPPKCLVPAFSGGFFLKHTHEMCMNGPENASPRCPPMYEFTENPGIYVTDIYRRFPGSYVNPLI